MKSIANLNSGVNDPGNDPGYTMPTGALIAWTDPTDLQESALGTTKSGPVLRILDKTLHNFGSFNPQTSSPNLQNTSGGSGYLYMATNTGLHNLGEGEEYFSSGWLLLHDGTKYNKYRRDSIAKNGQITPHDFQGTLGVIGTGNDTVLIQAALDSSYSNIYIPSGIYIVDNVELSANNKKVYGEGDIRLIDNATAVSGKGMFYVTGSGNTIEGLTFRGNAVNPPNTIFGGIPLRVIGSGNIITRCKFYDAKHDLPALQTNRNNCEIKGNSNIVSYCQSYNAHYACYSNLGDNNQYINLYAFAGTETNRSFNSTGGSSAAADFLLIDGLIADCPMVLDWASQNGPAIIEKILVKNCSIRTSINNIAAKFAHCRYLFVDNCYFEATVSSQEGITFGERLYDVTITNSFIQAGSGTNSSNSHIQSFPEGSKQRTINNFTLDHCIIGGTKQSPSGVWDSNAIEVNCFKANITNNIISQYLTAGLYLYPSETGVIAITNVIPPSPGEDNVWLVGTNPTGIWATHANEFAWWVGTTGPWLFEVPEYGVRVFDGETLSWYIWYPDDVNGGWIPMPTELFGYNIHDNQFIGRSDTTVFAVRSQGASTVFFKEYQRRSDIITFYNNPIINLTDNGTQETSSSLLQPIYQQLGPNRWWTDSGAPTQGIWFQGDYVQNIAATGQGHRPAYQCVASGLRPSPGLFIGLPAFTGDPE